MKRSDCINAEHGHTVHQTTIEVNQLFIVTVDMDKKVAFIHIQFQTPNHPYIHAYKQTHTHIN